MSKSGQKRKPRTLGLFIGTKVLWKIYLLGWEKPSSSDVFIILLGLHKTIRKKETKY
jgi:hypothetical protein